LITLDLWERLKIVDRKPKRFGKFNALLRRIAAVPKEVVEAKIAQAKAAKKLRRKK
jgi:hypothetical protein